MSTVTSRKPRISRGYLRRKAGRLSESSTSASDSDKSESTDSTFSAETSDESHSDEDPEDDRRSIDEEAVQEAARCPEVASRTALVPSVPASEDKAQLDVAPPRPVVRGRGSAGRGLYSDQMGFLPTKADGGYEQHQPARRPPAGGRTKRAPRSASRGSPRDRRQGNPRGGLGLRELEVDPEDIGHQSTSQACERIVTKSNRALITEAASDNSGLRSRSRALVEGMANRRFAGHLDGREGLSSLATRGESDAPKSSRVTRTENAGSSHQDLKAAYKYISQFESMNKEERIVHSMEGIQRYTTRQSEACKLYVTIMKAKYDLAVKYDLETRLWRYGIYAAIEKLRAHLKMEHGQLTDGVRSAWKKFISTSVALYVDLVAAFKAQWPSIRAGGYRRTAVSPCWHRSVNYLGDLKRYEQMYLKSPDTPASGVLDWSISRRYYREAAILCGESGLYHNQIAIVSNYDEHFLESFHAYLRSLTVKSPFLSAKDALTILFKTVEKRLTAAKLSRRRGIVDAQMMKMDFIRMHEILFTKVSTEHFPTYLSEFASQLKYFEPLVTSDSDEAALVFLQFASANGSMSQLGKFTATSEQDRDPLKDHLVSLAMHVMTFCLSNLLKSTSSGDENFASLSQGGLLYVWITLFWMASLEEAWLTYLQQPRYVHFWSSLANFCNALQSVMAEGESARTTLEDVVGVEILPEDWELNGSMLFTGAFRSKEFQSLLHRDAAEVDSLVDQHLDSRGMARLRAGDLNATRRRLWRILQVSRLLCPKISHLTYNEETGRFSVVTHVEPIATLGEPILVGVEEEEELEYVPHIGEESTPAGSEVDVIVDEAVQGLMEAKRQLNSAIDSRNRFLSSHKSEGTQSSSRMVPGETTIVFDTNIYLYWLDGIVDLANSGDWVISVPLVVVSELDGLKNSDDDVGLAAKRAVQFLDTEFGTGMESERSVRRKAWLKLQTSQGNFLHDLRIRTEDWTTQESAHERKKNNDDVILQCCWYFMQNARQPKNVSPVVLVTDDVNMKLKARTMGIDVRDRTALKTLRGERD